MATPWEEHRDIARQRYYEKYMAPWSNARKIKYFVVTAFFIIVFGLMMYGCLEYTREKNYYHHEPCDNPAYPNYWLGR